MAIAHDNSGSTFGVDVKSKTLSFTTSGSDRILFVYCECSEGYTITGVTYGGTAMTKVDTQTKAPLEFTLWYLVNPTTGTNDIIASCSGSTYISITASSYTGVLQTSPINGTNKSTSTGTSYSLSVTTTLDNSWAIMGLVAISARTTTAGSNTYKRVVNSAGNGEQILDTNSAQTPTGSKTMTVTSNSQEFFGIMVGFAPSLSSGPANLKSYNTNLKANIKSINTNLIANIKSLDTNI